MKSYPEFLPFSPKFVFFFNSVVLQHNPFNRASYGHQRWHFLNDYRITSTANPAVHWLPFFSFTIIVITKLVYWKPLSLPVRGVALKITTKQVPKRSESHNESPISTWRLLLQF